MKIIFTNKRLSLLSAPAGCRAVFYDLKVVGLALRVGGGGSKVFYLIRKFKTKMVWLRLGGFPELSINDVRARAQVLNSSVCAGVHPKFSASGSAVVLARVFNDYIKSRGNNLKNSSIKNYRGIFSKYLDSFASLRLSDIDRDAVEKMHREITKASPTRANATMRLLRALFNYAAGEYDDQHGKPLVLHNPVQRISHVKAWNRETRRQTIIKTYQIKIWWDAVAALPCPVSRDFFHFVFLSGLRKQEALGLKLADIDFNEISLTITNTKNYETHRLPLSDSMLAIVKRRRRGNKSELVFCLPGRANHARGVADDLRLVKFKSKISFMIHDLRRTFITIAESLDVSPYALKQMMNHKIKGDVTQGYIIADIQRLVEPMQKVDNFIKEKVQTKG